MSVDVHRDEKTRPVLARYADQPNLPEVSGTSFPLLTTVLAGFAITIAVQLIIRPDASEQMPGVIVAAIVSFLASTLLFISSIIFAVNAQSHNYLPFLDLNARGQQLLNVDDVVGWIERLEQRWEALHLSSILTFYGGIALLLAGVNLIVWEFVGLGVAIAFFLLIMFNLGLTSAVTVRVDRMVRPSIPEEKQPEVEGTVERLPRGDTGSTLKAGER